MAPDNIEKIFKYLTDDPNLDASERNDLRDGMSRRPEFRRRVEGTPPEWDVSRAKQRLFAAIEEDGSRRRGAGRTRPYDRPALKSRRTRRRTVAPIMLAVVLISAIGVLTLHRTEFFPRPQKAVRVEREFVTLRGQRTSMALGAEIEMHLNVESRAEVVYDPQTSEWNVRLRGEGYFTVAPATEHVLMVHAGEVSARVVGTEFGIRSFPEDEGVAVAVVKGRVEVETTGARVELGEGEFRRFAGGRLESTSRYSAEDLERFLSWRNGRLAFMDTPLGEAIPMIERWYDVVLLLSADGFETRRIYGVFDDERIEDVLEILSMSTGLAYRRQDDSFVLYAR